MNSRATYFFTTAEKGGGVRQRDSETDVDKLIHVSIANFNDSDELGSLLATVQSKIVTFLKPETEKSIVESRGKLFFLTGL
jgi:hypothetical protein